MNPNPDPERRRNSSTLTPANIANTPLRELFWSVPLTSVLLEEAEQRMATVLRGIFAPEPVQLFDDLYEDLAG